MPSPVTLRCSRAPSYYRALVLGIFTLLATARAYAEAPKPVTTVEGVSEYRLTNGVRVLLAKDDSQPKVTVNMTVLVGSRHEGYGEAGMAHLLEHMLFKGTPKFPEIPQALREHGAAFNGTTSIDRTNYFETMPGTADNLEFAISLEADRLVNSFLKEEDLASEMTVVRNEFERGENSPPGILNQRMMSAAFEWHNYGKSTIGNRADIERVPIENLRRFYKKYYQPDNIVLIIAGSFDPKFALSLAEKYFGVLPPPARELDDTYTEEPAQDGERIVRLRRVGNVGVAGVMYHIPASTHPDMPAIELLAQVLTSTPSGRLYKELVETKLAAQVGGQAQGAHDPSVLTFSAGCNAGGDPDELLMKLTEIIESVAEQGVPEEDLERARRNWLQASERAMTDSGAVCAALSECVAQGDWRLLFLQRDRIEAVKLEDLTAVAKKYLAKSNRTAGAFVPTKSSERTPIPAAPDLAKLFDDYRGREEMAAGEAFDVAPDAIERRTKRVILPSGVKAAFLPKKTRGETVFLTLTLRYGTADSLKGQALAASLMPQLMGLGTKELTRQQLRDALEKNQTQFGAGGAAGSATFQLLTKREFLVPALAIVKQILREPSFPEDELTIIKNGAAAQLEGAKSDPDVMAGMKLSRLLGGDYPPDDVRYVTSIEEQIERAAAITRDDLVALHREFLSGTVGELAIVGDFDPAEIQPIVEETLAGWTVDKPYQRISQDATVPPPTNLIRLNAPDRENASYASGTILPMSSQHPDYEALFIGNEILGGGTLSSRLSARVRGQEGLSYTIGSQLSASPLDDRASLTIHAISNPANIPKLDVAIREELTRILKDGVTEDELADAKKAYLEAQTLARSDDGQLAGMLATTLHLDWTMQHYVDQEQRIKNLTLNEVNQALAKWIDSQRLVVVEAGDFEE